MQSPAAVAAIPPVPPSLAGRLSDERLVAAVRLGDDAAFECLYDRYGRRIAGFVRGMVRDHGRAEDVTQEVFVSALRRLRATDAPIAFKPWIFEIARNACIDAHRRGRRAELVSLDGGDGEGPGAQGRRLAGPEPTPDAAAEGKHRLESLTGAFGGLSDVHHEILVMRELAGLSYQEIGARLGLTRSSVESTLFRARRRLEVEYEEILSGRRCVQVQEIVAGGSEARLGVRAEQRLARHLSYCQPCRREAAQAGFDVAALSVKPVRARIAAWLPLPLFLRRALAGDSGVVGLGGAPAWSEPATAGWGRAAAAVATLVLAGAGAGAGVVERTGALAQGDRATTAPRPGVVRTAPAASSSRTTRRPGAAAVVVPGAGGSGARGQAQAGASGSGAAAGPGGSGATTGTDRAPATGTAGGSGVAGAPTGPSGAVQAAGSAVEGAGDAVKGAGDAVKGTVSATTGAATGTVDAAAQTVKGATSGAPAPVRDAVGTTTTAVDGTAGSATDAANGVVSGATDAVEGTAGAAGGTVSGLLGDGSSTRSATTALSTTVAGTLSDAAMTSPIGRVVGVGGGGAGGAGGDGGRVVGVGGGGAGGAGGDGGRVVGVGGGRSRRRRW